VGLPLGFAMARSNRVQAVLTPALDLMQTLPAFVYLVPIVLVVGIGSLPGVLVAFVFAVPPIIRLTNLGLRNVPVPMFEAAQALGASPTKILISVEIPNALPTILLGVNQTIMMALAMVTYASMIGVGGLGRLVLQGIGRLDMGLATVGGLGIAALAILCSTLFATRPRERRGPAWAASPYALLKTMFGQVTPRGDARLPQRRYAPQGDGSHV
jgi:glycine betaine/proline transport system permease protein